MSLDEWEMKEPGPEDPFCPAGHLDACLPCIITFAAWELAMSACPGCSLRARHRCSGIEKRSYGVMVSHMPGALESIHVHVLSF